MPPLPSTDASTILWTARQAALAAQYDLERFRSGECANLAAAILDLASIEGGSASCLMIYRDSNDKETGEFLSRTLAHVAAVVDGAVMDAFSQGTENDWIHGWRADHGASPAGEKERGIEHVFASTQLVWPQGISELIEECRLYGIPMSRARQSEYMLALGSAQVPDLQAGLQLSRSIAFG